MPAPTQKAKPKTVRELCQKLLQDDDAPPPEGTGYAEWMRRATWNEAVEAGVLAALPDDRPMVAAMRPTSRLVFIALLALVMPATAAINSTASSMHEGRDSGDLDQWQRIDFRSSGLPRRKTAQIKVAIQTKGPSMQGLIRIPGAPASNFDTGNGFTVVDLINVGNDNRGYPDIVALEILFTQATPGQFYEVLAVDDSDRAK